MTSTSTRQAGCLRITIFTENAAFEDPRECSRILADLARRLEDDPTPAGFALRDLNGNPCGRCLFTPDEEIIK